MRNSYERERLRSEDEIVALSKFDVVVKPTIMDGNRTRPLLAIDVLVANKGSISIRPIYSAEIDKNQKQRMGTGLELTVCAYDKAEEGLAVDKPVIDWGVCANERTFILENYNMLEDYTSFKRNAYRIAPATTMEETVVIPVERGRLYGIRARFFTETATNADFAYVWIPNDG